MAQEKVCFQPNPDVLAQRLDAAGHLVLFHLRTDRFYQMNRTAARLWELLAAGHDMAGIRSQLLLEFDVEEAALDAEIDTTLKMMQKEELIIASSGA